MLLSTCTHVNVSHQHGCAKRKQMRQDLLVQAMKRNYFLNVRILLVRDQPSETLGWLAPTSTANVIPNPIEDLIAGCSVIAPES